MKVGTKSLLFGVHQVFIHPIFTALGWIKIYGFSAEEYVWWKLILCFIWHDWGYWNCSDMDGEYGVDHPELGGRIASLCLDRYQRDWDSYHLCIYHSRFYAKKHYADPSKLCWADKLGTASMPTWLWVFLARLSGELSEYIDNQKYEIHGPKCPYEFFNKYKNELVPKLLKENGLLK